MRASRHGTGMMDEKTSSGDQVSIVELAFARQARAFARSPLHTDPRRLQRLIEFLEPRQGRVSWTSPADRGSSPRRSSARGCSRSEST